MPTTPSADWRDPQPLDQAVGLPGLVYTDPEILRIESDAVLRQLARLLRDHCRRADVVANAAALPSVR